MCILLSARLKLINHEFHLENVLSITACLVIFATDLDHTTSTWDCSQTIVVRNYLATAGWEGKMYIT